MSKRPCHPWRLDMQPLPEHPMQVSLTQKRSSKRRIAAGSGENQAMKSRMEMIVKGMSGKDTTETTVVNENRPEVMMAKSVEEGTENPNRLRISGRE